MIIIASGGYCEREFESDFGRVPPAFLPIGNQRLFEHQVKYLRRQFAKRQIILSVPADYVVADYDLELLSRAGVLIYRADKTASLSASLLSILSNIQPLHDEIKILHGDTLVTVADHSIDAIYLSETHDSHSWEFEDQQRGVVWCGMFSFSSVSLFAEQLRKEPNFVAAVKSYDAICPLKRVFVEEWMDFGHLSTYFVGRTKITTERSFNSLIIENGVVEKRSADVRKLKSEAEWYQSIPIAMKRYTPSFYGFEAQENSAAYRIEYLPMIPLNDIWVFGNNPERFWIYIFKCFDDFFSASERMVFDAADIDRAKTEFISLTGDKTWRRLEDYFAQSGMDGSHAITFNGHVMLSPLELAEFALGKINQCNSVPGLLHGDLCLSNVLFDSRSQSIKLIDPRGLKTPPAKSVVGDIRYDIAKLAHSILGDYDHIISGRFHYTENGTQYDFNFSIIDSRDDVKAQFLESGLMRKYSVTEVMSIVVLLFLSMLPLHLDNITRQKGLFANAYRLYFMFLRGK